MFDTESVSGSLSAGAEPQRALRKGSPSSQFSARQSRLSVLSVVFWLVLSKRFNVGWLMPSRLAILV